MVATRETSRFGRGAGLALPTTRGASQRKTLNTCKEHTECCRARAEVRHAQNCQLNKDFTLVSYQTHQTVFESQVRPTKVKRTTSIMEHFLIQLINYQIVMKPLNIMTYTTQVVVSLHHHPPHQSGLRDQTNHGKASGKIVGGNHQQIHGGKDTRDQPSYG